MVTEYNYLEEMLTTYYVTMQDNGSMIRKMGRVHILFQMDHSMEVNI